MYSCGIDIGSVSSEAVIINRSDGDLKILSYEILPTGGDSKQTADSIFQKVLQKANISKNQVDLIIATGYGRINIPFADKNITEISCHARGVINYYPGTRTVVDVGGQDSKIIKLGNDGNPVDFWKYWQKLSK
jgi:activator of 2-hydroxyglutaryl-CoA dehydratase